jgi:phage recombination protein Bet
MAQTQNRSRPQQQRQAPPQQPPQQSKGAVALIVQSRLPMPVQASEAGISEWQWRQGGDVYWPTAKTPEGILRAFEFCRANQFDAGKRVCHVVGITDGNGRYIESVWPSIASVRIIATRTGLYVKTLPCEFGPDETANFGQFELTYPKWAQITVVRLDANGTPQEIAGPRLMWREYYATRKDSLAPNTMWAKKPSFMIEKCAEAGALRRAFPETLGNTYTDDEVHQQWGKIIDVTPGEVPPRPRREDFIEHKPAAQQQPSFIIVNIAGEEEEQLGAEATAKALETLWQEAARINKGALDVAKDNNAAALDQLREDGHGAVADRLLDSWNDHWMRAPDADKQGTAGGAKQGPRGDAPDRSPAAESQPGTEGRGAPDPQWMRDWNGLKERPAADLLAGGGHPTKQLATDALALVARAGKVELAQPLMHTQAMRTLKEKDLGEFDRVVTGIRQRTAELKDDQRG